MNTDGTDPNFKPFVWDTQATAPIDVKSSDQVVSVMYDGVAQYSWDADMVVVDELIDWCFKNTSHRFVILGTTRFYFEDKADAIAFKMRFGGKE